jgi:hypothetical protein
MFQIKSPVPDHLVDPLEAYFYESDGVSNWSLESIPGGHDFQLFGFFDNRDLAQDAWSLIRTQFGEIPDHPEIVQLPDRDWKEAYKDHFKPWSSQGLHWVPLWERDSYFVPNGEAALYLDPGMAFGTGNHETTRLCVDPQLAAGRLPVIRSLMPGAVPVFFPCLHGCLALEMLKPSTSTQTPFMCVMKMQRLTASRKPFIFFMATFHRESSRARLT